MGKKSEYRVLYNSKAKRYKIQEKVKFNRWSNLGHTRNEKHIVAYYGSKEGVDEELRRLHETADLEFAENWEIV